MDKVQLQPNTMLFPLPATLVSCRADDYAPNIITISWIGIVCSKPPMLSISVTPERHSHKIIKQAGAFVVNLTSEDNLIAADYCGTKSGRDVDKFSELHLTPIPATKIDAPMIAECPVNLECEIRQSYLLGSHEMFIAEIVAVHIDREVLKDNGRPDLDKIKPLVYCPTASEYRGGLVKLLARYGEAAKKNK
ncbi:MAG: flavin reductase family protein [candidate division Zixibacteria bacterium]|nr:flavin reductase family protein [candidate division Zixibacteria bacterium]